jgi:hypothetical protein
MSLLHRTHDRTDDADLTESDRHPDDTQVVHRRDPIVVADDRETKVRERSWTFAPGQIVSMIVGVGFVALGLVALIRAGIDGSLEAPVVEVLGFTHTAWLGLAEIGLGVLLILAGTGAWGRFLSVLLGAGMVIAGVLIGAETAEMPEELALEQDFGWMLVLFGGLVAVAAMALPVWRSRKVWRDGELVDDADRADTDVH